MRGKFKKRKKFEVEEELDELHRYRWWG